MRVSSRKLRASANGQECTVRIPDICNYNPETTVLAHLPCGQKGMGMGMKGFDTVAVYACSACHDVIDGRAAGDIDWQDMPRAIAETHEGLIRAGVLTVKGAA
ncbi:DUF1364 domain-containing protein [Pseudomonas sp. VE 196-7]|uniref:DUF1364 domain-containing protein n=1 Tax=Pseudomonas sp. VE 196-7 TaxID=2956726 RepID=UPI0021D4D789|nr:DUF1364 domain-containing protein [Pseudomonas sp. VE 196-7]MCU7217555.1 DUF1364 domain-containing protein [Pseudomonas sp. VE 196-7]